MIQLARFFHSLFLKQTQSSFFYLSYSAMTSWCAWLTSRTSKRAISLFVTLRQCCNPCAPVTSHGHRIQLSSWYLMRCFQEQVWQMLCFFCGKLRIRKRFLRSEALALACTFTHRESFFMCNVAFTTLKHFELCDKTWKKMNFKLCVKILILRECIWSSTSAMRCCRSPLRKRRQDHSRRIFN